MTRLGPMSGIRAWRLPLVALVAVACAAALGACGNDEPGTIPTDTGQQLLTQLDAVESAVEEGDCDTARENAVEFSELVSNLPEDVDGELRRALVEASANLVELTDDPEQCEPDTGPTGETGVTDEVTEVPEAPVPVEPEAPEEEDEPEEGDDGNQGGGQRDPAPGGGNQGTGNQGSGNQGGGNQGGGSDDDTGGIGSDE